LVRRLGVIVFTLLAFAALAPASLSDDRLTFALVGIEAQIGGDPVRSAGVVIDADNGLVLTTAHSLWGATSLRLSTGVGVLHGRIVARAPCADLALVETEPRIPGLVALTGSATPTGHLTPARRADGAPLLDDQNHIVGVFTRGGAVTRWPAVKRLLDRLKPDAQRVYVGWADQYRCARQLHTYEHARHPRYRETDARLNAPVPATRLPGTHGLDG
jgi:hypothetical protein